MDRRMRKRPTPLIAGRKSGAGLTSAPHSRELDDVFGVARFLPHDAPSVERNVGALVLFPHGSPNPIHPGLAPIFGCAALLNSLSRNNPWQDAAQDCAQPFELPTSLGCGVRHAHEHARSESHEAGKESQGFGNV